MFFSTVNLFSNIKIDCFIPGDIHLQAKTKLEAKAKQVGNDFPKKDRKLEKAGETEIAGRRKKFIKKGWHGSIILIEIRELWSQVLIYYIYIIVYGYLCTYDHDDM